ncbi:RNA polymerase sigma-70 factor [Pedobacter hiemivivus]|uniref:RNA polymerase sigma-70 factor n=1 Tax=Pedobacter hiemivivus TaxID=2530454 RepID=A0A4U1GEC7_9SPHI|nr:RNA polymerase sigma-70 factor [Pedobacter hiemivivus]TKC62435.1 RNA polymerase sigma-70 factor [Pedobacter hiemivivus]
MISFKEVLWEYAFKYFTLRRIQQLSKGGIIIMVAYGAFTDQQLLDFLKQGDQKAFNEIYDRYAPKIYHQVNQMLRDGEASKDVVQDLFIKIWDKCNNIRTEGNLAAYLYIAAQNNVLKFIRKGRLKSDYLNSLAQFQYEIMEEQGPDYDVEILYSLIEKEISQLPGKMKTIFELSRQKDLSYKDIAAQLGIAENTVRKQVSNALKIIRTNVDKYGNTGLILLALMRR